MKKFFLLIALVAFVGATVAPAIAMVSDVVVVELQQEDPKKVDKTVKKAEPCTEKKGEAKACCETKAKGEAKKEAHCETATKPAPKKEGEKK